MDPKYHVKWHQNCTSVTSCVHPFLIIGSQGGGLGPRGIWGRVQSVGQVAWVNTRPLVCGTPSAHSADAREARFFIELS